MKIGFCTAVMNRRWQLARTLRWNLDCLRGSGSFLAIADYNSVDDPADLVRKFENQMMDGSLVFFRTDEPSYFHSSRSKNLAHRLALRLVPDVLFNLDADNFVSDETLNRLADVFEGGADCCLHQWSTVHGDGSSGRIAMRSSTWKALGGYDEALAPVSWQDIDLLMRCRAVGVRYVHDDRGIPFPVANTVSNKLANLRPEDRADSDPLAGYAAMLSSNIVTSLGRPVRLSLDSQQRFTGTINLSASELVTV